MRIPETFETVVYPPSKLILDDGSSDKSTELDQQKFEIFLKHT